jgi:thymidylate kinase
MRVCGLSRLRSRDGVAWRERRFRAVPGLAHLFVLLQTIDQALEILLRLRRRGTVVADRCLYDTLVDLALETGLERLVIDRLGPLLERLLPRPRVVFLLEREPDEVLRDRPDVAADPFCGERRRLYAEVARRFGLTRVRVGGPVEDLVLALERQLEAAAGAIAVDGKP